MVVWQVCCSAASYLMNTKQQLQNLWGKERNHERTRSQIAAKAGSRHQRAIIQPQHRGGGQGDQGEFIHAAAMDATVAVRERVFARPPGGGGSGFCSSATKLWRRWRLA